MSTDRFNRLKDNLSRVDSLLALYEILQKEEARRLVSTKQDARSADILRAAVVLLHGSQEIMFGGCYPTGYSIGRTQKNSKAFRCLVLLKRELRNLRLGIWLNIRMNRFQI